MLLGGNVFLSPTLPDLKRPSDHPAASFITPVFFYGLFVPVEQIQSSISVSLQPLQDDLPISLLVRRSARDGVANDIESSIISSVVLTLKEACNILLRLAVREFIQTHSQETIKHNHVRTKSAVQLREVVLDVLPQPCTSLGVRRESNGSCVNVLGCDILRHEGQVIGQKVWCLNTAHCAESNFFAVYGSRGVPFLFESFILGASTITHSNTVDGRSKAGVDHRGIFTGGIKMKSAFGLGDNSSIALAFCSGVGIGDVLLMAINTSGKNQKGAKLRGEEVITRRRFPA